MEMNDTMVHLRVNEQMLQEADQNNTEQLLAKKNNLVSEYQGLNSESSDTWKF